MGKYIDVLEGKNGRKVTLCIEKDNTLTLLGILNHNSQLSLSIDNLKKLKNWCEYTMEEMVYGKT